MQTRTFAKTFIFNDQGQLLLMRRSADDSHRPGCLDLPGGQIEDEHIIDGAIREVEEETGLRLDQQAMRLVFATTKIGRRSNTRQNLSMVWLGFVSKLSGSITVRLSSEHQAYSWHTLDQALKICDGPTQRAFLNHLRDHEILKEYWSYKDMKKKV